MSVFSDTSILEAIDQGRVRIDPFDPEMVQPASIDIKLGGTFRVFRNHTQSCIDPKMKSEGLTEEITVGEEGFVVHPGEFILGVSLEKITVGDDLVARLEGKSSLGRIGLLVHATAGYIDPGFSGQVTLEISNIANLPIKLYPGMKIGQISFLTMTTVAAKPYGSNGVGKYQGQMGPTDSRIENDFKTKQPV